MLQHISVQIAIVGAGVVGLTVAEALVAEGHEVVLIDPNPPGSGASYGNAGTIADYAVQPVGTPSVLRGLPSLLFNRNSPLAIRPGALPSLVPWLTRFGMQALPWAARRNAVALAGLLSGATPLWRELAGAVGGMDLFEERGCLYIYETAAAFRAAEKDMAQRRALGVEVALITPDALAALEPEFPPVAGGAAYFPAAAFLTDPGAMVERLRLATMQHAGFLWGKVDRLTRQIDGVILEGAGFRLHARQVVLATGAHGRDLAAMAGDVVPLETERGYHVEWDMPEPTLNRPCCPTSRGFYFCPMQGRLRVAGTVELGGLTAPPSLHRIERLIEGAQSFFPMLGEPDRTWMGFRPSMPDSLPVIGPSKGGADVIHAFGHGHIGLT
ncbi:MAG: FAD-dependent oxidoreductase, partial [Pseudorhodobacter sp.]|nr:FAD-dependent oxidoreductase [Pseudorhodobacter sp.]